jgi:hypothetical protein
LPCSVWQPLQSPSICGVVMAFVLPLAVTRAVRWDYGAGNTMRPGAL